VVHSSHHTADTIDARKEQYVPGSDLANSARV
jgi:hypothetical protein